MYLCEHGRICKKVMINWICLLLAGCCEIGFTFCLGKLKDASGSSYALWIVGFALLFMASMPLLIKATHTIPVGTAYTVFTGIGAMGAVLIGILFFHDPVNFWRIFFITTLILSIVGLKIV